MKVEINKSEFDEMKRRLSKLNALEAGGVDNWEWYDESLKEWHKKNEEIERVEDAFEAICEALIDGADIDYPAGTEVGHAIHINFEGESDIKKTLFDLLKG